jgi:hypothetical protein
MTKWVTMEVTRMTKMEGVKRRNKKLVRKNLRRVSRRYEGERLKERGRGKEREEKGEERKQGEEKEEKERKKRKKRTREKKGEKGTN